MAIIKEVKKYSERYRINLNKGDDLKDGQKVYILSDTEFNYYKDEIWDLTMRLEKCEAKAKAIKEIAESNQTRKEVLQYTHEQYEKQLQDKDNELKQKDNELNNFKAIVTNFLIQLNGLKLLDFIFRSKHKELINDLQSSVWIGQAEVEIISENDDKMKLDEN